MTAGMTDIMLDLETLGNGSNAAIVSVGAVAFSLEARRLGGDTFNKVVDIESSVAAGGEMSVSTVLWWLKQDIVARNIFKMQGSVATAPPLDTVLGWFTEWGARQGDWSKLRVWGNGAGFDNVILRNAYQRLGRQAPWDFWNDCCYRTVTSQFPGIRFVRKGTHHDALDDAISQAEHLIKCYGSGEPTILRSWR